MKRAAVLVVLLCVTSVLAAGVRETSSNRGDPDGLIAHEWGTFTTVAGADGTAVDWLPLSGPQDLPCFVERFKDGLALKGLAGTIPLTYDAARAQLLGKVRMETPVVYLYSPVPMTADVRVRFPRGLITEWYPRAKVTQWAVTPTALAQPHRISLLEWRGVKVTPQADARFPMEPGESHYYAARDTDASPLDVNGQREKFLFYRGVGSFDVPVSAVARADGTVRITNVGARPLRGVILFQNVDGRVGYRAHGTLSGEATLAAPSTADPALVRDELERVLTDAGLYPREARAMVATWRDSWFEEGTRVFYILAPGDVDAVLPLTIEPKPVQTARVFVGRMEIVTPHVLGSVRRAIAGDDTEVLERHGRFLGPIVDRILAGGATRAETDRIGEVTRSALASAVGTPSACR